MRLLIIPIFLLLISCTSTLPSIKTYKMDVQQGNVITPKMMLQLKPAMTKSQVRFILGTPLLADTFHRDRWDYFYEMNRGGKVIERRRVILEFENETLKSVRGDIIPAGQPGAEDAQVASIREIRSARSNKELLDDDAKKTWWERFKFWGDETIEEHQQQRVDARTASIAKPSPSNPPASDIKSETAAVAKPQAQVQVQAAPAKAKQAMPATEKQLNQEKVLAPPVQSEAGQIAAQLQRWNLAWQQRKLNDYLNLYSANFTPEGMGRRTWLEKQQQKFGSAEYVEDIKIENVQVDVHGSIATVEFDQISSTSGGTKKTTKEMAFENEGGLWRIVRESEKTEFAPQDLQKPTGSAQQSGVLLHERSEQPPEYPSQPVTTPAQNPEAANPSANSQANTSKSATTQQAKDKNSLPELKGKKDLPLPAEDEPGYFEKLLEKIGF